MLMTMCMIMNMNIYISKDNEQKLRAYNGSMSGLINKLLDQFFTTENIPFVSLPDDGKSHNIRPDVQKISPVATQRTLSGVSALERGCCVAKKTCNHWVWQDSGIFINSLSGREREADI